MPNVPVAEIPTPRLLALCGGLRNVVIAWFLVSVTDAFRAITYMRTITYPVAYGSLAVYAVSETVMWTVTTLMLLWLVDRWPKRGRVVSMLLAAATLLGTVLLNIGITTAVFSLTGFSKKGFASLFLVQLPRNFHTGMLVVVTVLVMAIHLRDRHVVEARRLRESRLENELLQAQLHSVSAQLQPHFLFNMLNGVTAMMHKDARMAENMITGLGDLLRFSLSYARETTGTLDDELYFVERYLFLQHARLGDRMHVELAASDEARQSLFPRFVLQPLVENAVKHGIDVGGDQPGEIAIAAEVHRGLVEVRIRNTAPDSLPQRPDGVGLSSVRKRLALMYGTAHTLDFERAAGSVTVTITVPRVAAGTASE